MKVSSCTYAELIVIESTVNIDNDDDCEGNNNYYSNYIFYPTIVSRADPLLFILQQSRLIYCYLYNIFHSKRIQASFKSIITISQIPLHIKLKVVKHSPLNYTQVVTFMPENYTKEREGQNY